MGKNDIKLSPKYGVNPTIPVCFWCGKEKNEIALLGKIGDGRKGEDIEAPKNMVLDYTPCDECQNGMGLGVTMIEVTDHGAGLPPIKENLYPTGRWCVIKHEAAKRIIDKKIYNEDCPVYYVDKIVYEHMFITPFKNEQ